MEEALGVSRFWANAASELEARSDVGDVQYVASAGTDDDEETDEEDSFIDLVFNPHNRGVVERDDEASRNDFHFIESPRDVLLSKVDSSCSKPMSPVTIPRSANKKFKLFMLGFRKPSKSDCSGQQEMVNTFSRSSSNRSCHVLAEKSVRTYLNMIKPLYVKVSKKVKMSYVTPSPLNPSESKLSEGSRLGSFKIVASSLRKSRSASATASSVLRRDEPSLVGQHHDGIQEAILHCKRSYNSSSQELSQLFLSSTNLSDGNQNQHEFKSNRKE